MFIQIGVIVSLILFTISLIKNIYDKYVDIKDNSIKTIDEDLKTRIEKLENFKDEDLKVRSQSCTRDEMLSIVREFKIEIRAEIKEFQQEIKGEIKDLGKKIDNLKDKEYVTRKECKYNHREFVI